MGVIGKVFPAAVVPRERQQPQEPKTQRATEAPNALVMSSPFALRAILLPAPEEAARARNCKGVEAGVPGTAVRVSACPVSADPAPRSKGREFLLMRGSIHPLANLRRVEGDRPAPEYRHCCLE